jgi:hypothetical protein
MNTILRALAASLAAIACLPAQAADGIAFITNLKGEVAVDGAQRPMLMSELAKGQRLAVGKDSQLAVMYIQSGKEYVLKGPADYTVGERAIASRNTSSRVRPTTRLASAKSLRAAAFRPPRAKPPGVPTARYW